MGAVGTVLTVDGAGQPAWSTPAGGVRCQSTMSAVQAVATATAAALLFDTDLFDTDAIHSIVADTSRFVVPAGLAGKWRFAYGVRFNNTNAVGYRMVGIRKNGNAAALYARATVSTPPTTIVPHLVNELEFDLVAGDFLECIVEHTAGVSLNCGGGTEEETYVIMERLSG